MESEQARGAVPSRPFSLPAKIVFAVYLLVVFVALWHHEPWRDEADTWLLARDATVPQILQRMSYVGCPATWYLLVAPLAKTATPYFTQSLLNYVFISAAVGLLLWQAPFSLLLRTLIVFSFFFSYEYAVIARPYSLLVLVLFTLAWRYPHRYRHPATHGLLLALLANTTVHGLFIAFVLGGVFLLEAIFSRRHSRAGGVQLGLALAALGGIIATLQLLPGVVPGADAQFTGLTSRYEPNRIRDALRGSFVPLDWAIPTGLISLAIIGMSSLVLLRERFRLLLPYWITLALLMYVFVFKWYGGARHAGLIVLVTIFFLWLSWQPNHAEDGLDRHAGCVTWLLRLPLLLMLQLSMLISCAVAAGAWWREVSLPFTGSREAAMFIAEHVPANEPIIGHRAMPCESLLPYLPGRSVFYGGIPRWGTYMLWDKQGWMDEEEETTPTVVLDRAKQELGSSFDRAWLVLTEPLENPAAHGFTLVYQTNSPVIDSSARDEIYYVYQPARAATQPADSVEHRQTHDHAGPGSEHLDAH